MTVNPISNEFISENNSASNNGILGRLSTSSYIKNKVDQIKADDDFRNENELKMSDRRKSNILDIAEFIEGEMNQYGSAFAINQISTYITRIFEKAGLEKYSYLILEVLPDKYKDKNKDAYKKHQSRLLANKIKRSINDIRAVDYRQLDGDSLRELKNMILEIPDSYEKQLLVMDEPLSFEFSENNLGDGGKQSSSSFNQLDSLKEIEDNRFKKASIGEPLSTAEKLCAENPEYAREFPELVKTLDQAVRGMEIIRDWFTKEYPPLDIIDLRDLTSGFKIWNEYWRPYYDRKYRRDHTQSINTAYMRVLHTSTKASHESQIPCAHYLDKNGNPVMRGMTKEQIDAMYEWEINFNQKLTNTFIQWPHLISRVNAKHGGRALEDRAIALSGTLSHHA